VPVLVPIAAALLAAQAEQPPAPLSDSAEIIVTGERVKRSLRETQSSVSVATQRDIEAASADRVKQVLALIPNVQIGSGSEGPAIRGLDTTGALQGLPAFLGGNRPRTTLIVDGRRDTYHEFVFGAAPAWDVDRIEVFRSPQTTTQGQNSIAGAIFVYTNEPTFEPEVRVRAIGGTDRTGQLSAVASGPVSGDIALRVSGDLRYSRTPSRIVDRVVGADPNHDVYGLARAKLLVKPRGMPGSRLELTFAHVRSQAPQVVPVTPPFKKWRDAEGGYGVFRINVDSLTASLHQQLRGNLTADMVVTGGDSNVRRLAPRGLGQAHIRGRDWSAEAVFNWTPEGPLRAVGGISRTHLKLHQFIDLSVLSGLGRFSDRQDSTGVFGEASVTILPRTTLTAGIRYQQDRQKRSGALGTEVSSISLEYDRTFHAWLPKVSLAYDFSRGVRAGVMVQRAFNPGGTTLRFDTGQPDNFQAETLWDFEAFARARLAEGVNASANLFYYDMHDAQRARDIRVIAPAGFPIGFADLFNVPKARSYGLEGELDWRVSRRLSARTALGVLRTRFVRSAPGYEEFAGNQFARSPHFSAAGSIDWSATRRLRLSAQARYHSAYYSTDLNTADVRVRPSVIVDARAEYRVERFTLFAYARNLFDKFALIDKDPFSAIPEDPREVRVGLETRF
jgi:iron complex outermembrane receptor protein